jgi:hypothetical protein
MACPFFRPSAPISPQPLASSAIFPLGDCWSGECRAHAGAPAEPDPKSLRTFCNFGYARGGCDRFPDSDSADAVRFTISSDDDATVGIYYVLERDHHPFAHGPIEYSRTSRSCDLAAPELQSLAEAYAASYLRRKHD